MKTISILLSTVFNLTFVSGAFAANSFPYSVAGLKWSKALDLPHDGRWADGFSNGCTKLDSNKNAILEYGGYLTSDFNMCHDGTDFVSTPENSEAANVCRKIGGHLPSAIDYSNVIAALASENPAFAIPGMNHLTQLGLDALSAKFGGENVRKVYWTSTIHFLNGNWGGYSAYIFDGTKAGYVSRLERRNGAWVRCVEGL